MIVEHVFLPVRVDDREDFIAAFRKARQYIEWAPGFRQIDLNIPLESDGPLLLLVQWETVSHHRQGFRTSAAYQEWRRLLHPFYPAIPAVSYFLKVDDEPR